MKIADRKIMWLEKYLFMIIISFMAGYIICGFVDLEILKNIKYVYAVSLKKISGTYIDKKELFSILLQKRYLFLCLAGILGITNAGKAIISIFVLWCGFGCGTFFRAMLKLNGIKGFAVALSFLLPQYLVYIPAFVFLIGNVYKFTKDNACRKSDLKTLKIRPQYIPVIRYVTGLFFIAVMFLAGILLEAYINPIIIKNTVKIL